MTETNIIRRSEDDYGQVILDLMPLGGAWPRDEESNFVKLIHGFAQIFGFVDQRIADFFDRESDPRSALEMLSSWEAAFALPSQSGTGSLTVEDRLNALIVKLTSLGGQSREFFINTASRLGYKITIEEFAPFMCGLSECGDTTPEGEGKPIWEIGHPDIRFYWVVKISETRLSWFRVGSGQTGIDPHLIISSATELENMFKRLRPAQTEIVFDYSNQATR